MSEKDALYTKWLEFAFNRPVSAPVWYFTENNEFKASPAELVYLIGRTCEQSSADLAKYSNAQVNNGLCYIFSNSASNIIFSITQKGVDEQDRIEAVRKMKILYHDCLAKRCDPILGHKREENPNPLGYFCYMLWDVSPLCQWKDVVIEVMEAALYLSNPACIESGLHGLGHRHKQNPDKVESVIDKFLSKSKSIGPELRIYAQQARTGCIQ
jgi:hypothetical protein